MNNSKRYTLEEAEKEIVSLRTQRDELVEALEKIVALDYRYAATNGFGWDATRIVNTLLTKIKESL